MKVATKNYGSLDVVNIFAGDVYVLSVYNGPNLIAEFSPPSYTPDLQTGEMPESLKEHIDNVCSQMTIEELSNSLSVAEDYVEPQEITDLINTLFAEE